MSTREFTVIDLFSQGRAVQRHVQDWPREDVLAWLQHWGTVNSWQYVGYSETHAFRSWCGMLTLFLLEDGQFTFLGDHTIAIPPE